MKKYIKIISILFILTLMLTLSGCSAKRPDFDTKEFNDVAVVTEEKKEGYTFIGYLKNDEENKTAVLYLKGAEIPAGEYEIIYIENKKLDSTNGYSYPEIPNEGLTFAGWYETEDFQKGTRVANTTNLDANVTILYARYITFVDACLVAFVCMLIVFLMLALLWGVVALFKYIAPKETSKKEVAKVQNQVVNAPQKVFTIDDIVDEDMMVATLVASIEYRNETHNNVRVVSVKQIG